MKPPKKLLIPRNIDPKSKRAVEFTHEDFGSSEADYIKQVIRSTAKGPIPRVRSGFLETLAKIIAGEQTSYQWYCGVDFKWIFRTNGITYRGKSDFNNFEMNMYASHAFPLGVNHIKVGKYEVIQEPTGMPNESRYVFINPADLTPPAE